MAAQAVLFLQNGGYINVLTNTVWNTSWLLPEDGIAGRLLHTLVGYSEAPDGAQIIAYLATIAMMLGLMRTVGKPAPRAGSRFRRNKNRKPWRNSIRIARRFETPSVISAALASASGLLKGVSAWTLARITDAQSRSVLLAAARALLGGGRRISPSRLC